MSILVENHNGNLHQISLDDQKFLQQQPISQEDTETRNLQILTPNTQQRDTSSSQSSLQSHEYSIAERVVNSEEIKTQASTPLRTNGSTQQGTQRLLQDIRRAVEEYEYSQKNYKEKKNSMGPPEKNSNSQSHLEQNYNSKKSSKPQLTAEERYTEAFAAKEFGNKATKEKNYEEAFIFYKSALNLIDPNRFSTPAEGTLKEKLNELRIALLNNMTQSCLNLNQIDQAYEYAEKVILLDPENIKALFRIAVCLENQGKHLAAFERIKEIYRISNRKKLNLAKEVAEAYQRLHTKVKLEGENYQEQDNHVKDMDQKIPRAERKSLEELDFGNFKIKKGFMVVPSVGIAYLILSQGLKASLKTRKSRFAMGFLTASLFGIFLSSKLWVKGIFAATSLFITGLAHNYK